MVIFLWQNNQQFFLIDYYLELILQYLPNSSDIVTYHVAKTDDGAKVIVDIDSDNTSNLAFSVDNKGNVTAVDDCSVKDYKDEKTCGEDIDNTYEKKD